MAEIKTGILGPIQQLIGSPALGGVVLDDDSVTQTLPVVPDIARRGAAQGSTGGWFLGILENVHSAGDNEDSNINPYEAGLNAAGSAWPPTVPPGFDVWVLGVSGHRSVGTGGLTMAMMGYNAANNGPAFGWGKDDAGAAVAPVTPTIFLARFDALEEGAAGLVQDPMITEQGLTFQPIRMRLPRAGTLSFFTTSAAAAEFQAMFLMGLFPAALGQDILG